MSRTSKSRGGLVAAALAGSWQLAARPLRHSAEELAEITPPLIQSGAGALVWWRIRESALADSESAAQLHELYRLHRLEASVHVREIKQVIALFREAGVEPVLVKGWSAARLYPEPGLRHYDDIDLCVKPDRYTAAHDALDRMQAGGSYVNVDLHCALDHLDRMSWDEMFARTELLPLEDVDIRVPCAEDHLRILCIHWLRHGAWRAAGLCDIAAALESRPEDFDWERCLGADPKRADWVACAIGLAHQLLGAQIENTPVAARARKLPRWLVPAVLRQWHLCVNPDSRKMALPALTEHLLKPGGLLQEIRTRWDHPIRATIQLHGSFNDWPRLPYQLGAWLMRSRELPRQLTPLARR
jgi:hypothetical protein